MPKPASAAASHVAAAVMAGRDRGYVQSADEHGSSAMLERALACRAPPRARPATGRMTSRGTCSFSKLIAPKCRALDADNASRKRNRPRNLRLGADLKLKSMNSNARSVLLLATRAEAHFLGEI